jgi:DMSO/TMAO reductase YedYZ molybdopterin-dependent catalytic subunit
MPVWDPAVRGVWRLEVSGLVRTPLSLTLDDLMKLPHITQKVDHFLRGGLERAR